MQREKVSKKECGNCRFWNHITQKTGECRKKAPRPGRDEYSGKWPKTASYSWCGEYESFSACLHNQKTLLNEKVTTV